MPGSTLFRHARLVGYPADRQYRVLVRDGLVAAIDDEGQADLQADEERDLAGETFLAPSLADNHTHFSSWALSAQRIDLYTALSAAEVLVRMRAWLPAGRERQHDPAQFLIGMRMRVGEWPDLQDMNRAALDTLEQDRPLAIFFAGYHSLCANSPALRKLGIDPEGHGGVLEEAACFRAWTIINEVPDDAKDAAVADAARRAAAQGITEILDLEMDFNLSAWRRRVSEKGITQLRVRCGMYAQHLPSALAAGHRTGDVLPGTDGLVTVGPHKIITDGSLGSRTACCHDPYPGEPSNRGHFEYPPQTLLEMMRTATNAGMTLAVHAIGDRANELTLSAFAALDPPALPGSSIEHAQLLSLSDLPRFAALGLVASIQPTHMADDRELAEQFWPGRTARAFPFKALVDAGATLRMGSDAPVAPVDPWDAMAVAISRSGRGQAHLPPWHPEQAITPLQAWTASTASGKPRLEVGDRADLVLLAKDPLGVSAEELREMEVRGTMLDGRWTHLAV
ncbi:hypothetical protein JCM10450v2_004575 [Rhodotorula kratochvilovae]